MAVSTGELSLATLGGGCFWCLEAVFEQLRGVASVTSGYAGGTVDQPTYEQVCTGRTGHAEVIQIAFDPTLLSFRDLLDVFFAIHDPTTLNRQGADVGTQYRSVIYYHSPEQQSEAIQRIAELNAGKTFPGPIVTEVSAMPEFFPAEGYHQGYFRGNARQSYCQLVVSPKVAKFRSKFADHLKD
ncbi:MAG: peptide-methionine (S)-S-oxide reductase MsrA [Planctomycetes bacterium]|nr:peptide-methionine (S)-S-oxide reductase MsrA [Planctomycetota bacterium]